MKKERYAIYTNGPLGDKEILGYTCAHSKDQAVQFFRRRPGGIGVDSDQYLWAELAPKNISRVINSCRTRREPVIEKWAPPELGCQPGAQLVLF